MSGLAVFESFIEAARQVRTSKELENLVGDVAREIGFDYFALVHHVDLSNIAAGHLVALTTYPWTWVETYIERNIVINDPVHLASHRTAVGFRWEDVPKLINVTAAHRKITEDTRRAGIEAGYTVPANVPGEANGSCSFAMRSGRDLPDQALPLAQLVGSFAFQAARSLVVHQSDLLTAAKVKLTQRQLECIALVGRGKTDWEISRILGISEDTVTEYLDEARRRYDVPKRIQLVMRAVFDGKITISDVLR